MNMYSTVMTNGFDMFYVEHYVKYRAIIQYCITDHMSLSARVVIAIVISA